MAKNFPNVIKEMNLHIQYSLAIPHRKVQRALYWNRLYSNCQRQRHNLESIKREETHQVHRSSIILSADCYSETVEASSGTTYVKCKKQQQEQQSQPRN